MHNEGMNEQRNGQTNNERKERTKENLMQIWVIVLHYVALYFIIPSAIEKK